MERGQAPGHGLIARALDAGIPCSYVLADALYGSDKSLRVMLEQRAQPHILAVRSNERLMGFDRAFCMQSAAEIADALEPEEWSRLAAGEGAKGPRLYDWARVRLFRLQRADAPFDHWLLVRRSLRNSQERAFYIVFAPRQVSLAELAGVAGLRWTIETCFETAKSNLGLDHCEARSWHGWHRHVTLVMAALAFLAKMRARPGRLHGTRELDVDKHILVYSVEADAVEIVTIVHGTQKFHPESNFPILGALLTSTPRRYGWSPAP